MTTAVKIGASLWTPTTNGFIKTASGWTPIDKIYQKAFESKEEKFDIVYLCKFSPI